VLGHSKPVFELAIASLDGVVPALTEERHDLLVLGGLFVSFRVFDKLIDGSICELLNDGLDKL
jgi:hypothetical protein